MCIQPSPKYPACISSIFRCFIMHQCTSEFHTHHAKYSPNLHKYTTHHSGIYSTLYSHHPKILKIYIAKDHAQAHASVSICSHQSGLFIHNLWCLALISDQSPRTAIPHLHSLKSIGAWFSFNFCFLYTFHFFLLLHFFSFLLIYSMFHVSNICGLVHSIQITISEYFWVFVCTFMYL